MQALEMEKRPSEETVAAHYEKLLGISRPWKVLTAQLDLLRGKVEIEVGWEETAPVMCPECGRECPRHDHGADILGRTPGTSPVPSLPSPPRSPLSLSADPTGPSAPSKAG